MKMDKKSIIQIVLLVVLLAGGAGAYLMQQDGGFDIISSITGLFESEPPKIRAPATPPKSPAADAKTSTAASTPAPAPTVIPSGPAQGQVHGKPFLVENSSFEGGVLTLRLGKDVAADLEVKVLLPGTSWETPAGKKYSVKPTSTSGNPEVMLVWREDGQKKSSEQNFTDKYTMVLEFGAEKDKKLPGKIKLDLPDATKSSVAGTFDATIKGFRIIDGKPDLSADSVDTLQYLALHQLLKDDPNKSLEIVSFRDGRYVQPEAPAKNMTGYLEAEYRIGKGSTTLQRFQFEKTADAWKIAHVLDGNQLEEAHPLQAPNAKSSPSKMLTFLAAKKLESDFQKKNPNKNIYRAEFMSRHSDKFKMGVCEASYRLAATGEPLKTTYLFRRQTGGWKLERELSGKEKVNFDTGKIVKR